MRARILLAILVLILTPLAPSWAAPNWILENTSRLGFIATQGGAPVEGLFTSFKATITFDANDLAGSIVAVEIDIASVDSKSKDRDDAIRGPGLFDAAQWPTATFKAAKFRQTTKDWFEAEGTLTMRGVTMPAVLPFTLKVAPHPSDKTQLQARAEGRLTVQRLDYGIGQGPWKDTSIVGNDVIIFLDLVAKQ